MSLNIICAVLFFALQIAINFFLAPFILEHLGQSAYGFLVLCNSIVSWGYIFSTLINALSSRFVAFHYHKNELKAASEFYSTSMLANMILSFFSLFLAAIFLPFLPTLLGIDEGLIFDVRLAFGIYALNFTLGLFVAVFGIHAFVKNQLYLISLRQTLGTLATGLCIFGLYASFEPLISSAAAAALFSSFLVLISSVFMAKKLQTGLKFRLKDFKIYCLKKLAISGLLNSAQSLSQMLLNSIDLLLVNAFLGSAKMGILALSKAVTMFMISFVGTLGGSFMPTIVSFYAKGDTQNLCSYLRFVMRLLCFIGFVPMGVFTALCPEFYALWLSGDTLLIARLAMISALPALFMVCMYPLLSLNIATNNQKRATISMLILAGFSVLAQFLALHYGFELFGVVWAASALYCAKLIFFDVLNAAFLLNLKPLFFYFEFAKNIIICFIIFTLFWFFKGYFITNTWLGLIFCGFTFVIFGYAFAFLCLFDKGQKVLFLNKIKGFIKK